MLDERDIRAMLTLRGSEREELFCQARATRAGVYGDRVVVRAVVEVTNLCRVDCDFCPMRRSNTRANAVFHQTAAEMIETAIGVHALGANVICRRSPGVGRRGCRTAGCSYGSWSRASVTKTPRPIRPMSSSCSIIESRARRTVM
ncbi:hypothetical protein ACN28G_15340 [Micromonospora sp. WMMA1923]|uniref:hypothetical protein n=1 Tax=Micromonospora sp. WMMA1923 TaxID=3404125 RepID=UPI003B949DB5